MTQHWAASKFPGVILATVVLVVALGLGATRIGKAIVPAGTFKTTDLIVDQTATLGATATSANQATIHVNNTTNPIEIDHDGTNSQTVAVIVHGTNITPQPTNERQAVNALIDTTLNTTLGPILSMGFQTSVNSSRVAGANPLTNAAFVASAQNGDDNISFLGIHGTLENDEGALIKSNGGANPVTLEKVVVQSGGFNVTGTGQDVILGDTVESFAMPNASGGVSPQITLGVALHAQPYMIAAKPTVVSSIDAIWLALDTTINAAARGGFIVSRGAGGFGASVEGGIAIAAASGFPLVGMAANDIGLFMEGGGAIVFGADNSGFTAVTEIKQSNHWVQMASTGLPGLGAGCTSGGGSSIVGNDKRFEVVMGVGSTSCVVTFVKTFTTKPMCTVTPLGGVAFPNVLPAAATFTFTTNVNSGDYVVDCDGQPGGT